MTGPQRGGVEGGRGGIRGWTASVDPGTSLNHAAPMGKGGTGAAPEIPVALLSGQLNQRPELLINTLLFAAGLGYYTLKEQAAHFALVSAFQSCPVTSN